MADSTRRRCPSCGQPDALVLFNIARCHSPTCRMYDPDLDMTDEERFRRWGAFVRVRTPYWN